MKRVRFTPHTFVNRYRASRRHPTPAVETIVIRHVCVYCKSPESAERVKNYLTRKYPCNKVRVRKNKHVIDCTYRVSYKRIEGEDNNANNQS